MERVRNIPDFEKLDYEGIQVWDNVFPARLFSDLVNHCFILPDRKTTYLLEKDQQFPPPLPEAAALVTAAFSLDPRQINTAVVKRYEPNESSGAFEYHQDPEEYEGGDIFNFS